MIFIGGISDKRLTLGYLKSVMCKHCRQTYIMELIKSYSFFHFFFLPLWKWQVRYELKCERCQAVMTISNVLGKAWEQGEELNLTLWDLQIIKEGNPLEQHCGHCQETVAQSYQYCPHCGQHLEK